ncbi:hypothetical protein ABZY05_15800 [Streptomyces canus]|uniref:hypothetical protein n=1 Tax=Streptomyces canus TaxID=58343 RepID=UPI0033B4F5AF
MSGHADGCEYGKGDGGKERRLPLIRLTVPAPATLLAATALITHHSDAHHLQQHHWRALHQTRATVSHHNRRGDALPTRLRPWRQPEQNRSQPQDLRLQYMVPHD